jgi:hypothetical protein
MSAPETKHQLGDPISAAKQFAESLLQHGLVLDFSRQSLETKIDQVFELPLFRHGRRGILTAEQARSEAGLAAYVGETLRREFSGEWQGEFYPDAPPINYYTSFVKIRHYRFFPSHSIAYRIANGSSQGTLTNYLRRIVLEIREAIVTGI